MSKFRSFMFANTVSRSGRVLYIVVILLGAIPSIVCISNFVEAILLLGRRVIGASLIGDAGRELGTASRESPNFPEPLSGT